MTHSFRTLPRILLVAFAVELAFAANTTAQLSFSDSSGLSRPAYLNDSIRDISDAQLWNAVDLDRPGLSKMRQAVRAGQTDQALASWAAYWSSKQQPRYITSMDHLLLDTDILLTVPEFQQFVRESPGERDLILARAEDIMRNKIRTWGDSVVDYGERVDFNREIGQSGKYGFHYWIWSRPLVMAWAITGDEKYLAKFDQLFHRWYEQRNSITRSIAEFDVVYYELGLGIRNRAFLEYYLSPFSGRSPQTHLWMLKSLLAAGRWLYQQEKWEGYRAGNWQIHGSYMLAQLGLALPEFRESAEWRRMGLQRMMEHMQRDFFADGGHSERSPRNYTMGTYLTFRNLAYLLTAYDVEPEAARRIRASMGRTLDWWKTIITPTGELPAINDSHRGLFPMRVMHDGLAFFGKGSQPFPQTGSRHMPESGFTVMRSDSTRDALYLLVNYGPFAGFHSHYDLLDFELYAFGKALAVDAGLGMTYDDPLYPDYYRSSRAHNMVVVNDSNIEREGMQGENIRWGSTPSVDYFAADQKGYRRFGVQQRRQIAFIKPSYWLILDDLQCTRGGDTLSWYFHSPTPLVGEGSGFVSTTAPGVRIVPIGSRFMTRTGKGIAASSSDYTPGKTEEIGWVRFDQLSSPDSPAQFPVLLFPFRQTGDVPITTRCSPQHYTVQAGQSTDHLYFADGGYSDSELQTDGYFVLIREDRNHRRSFTVINGTYLRYGKKTVWKSESMSSGQGNIQ